jgi:hypothetical protein
VIGAAGEIQNKDAEVLGAGANDPDRVDGGDGLPACLPSNILLWADARFVGGAPHHRVPAAGIGVLFVVAGVGWGRVGLLNAYYLEDAVGEISRKYELLVPLSGSATGDRISSGAPDSYNRGAGDASHRVAVLGEYQLDE